ncbi:30S ribosomal protein S12 methylthiotransferase RimO [Sporosalibacterium faouarense]|uniref:30S ribosomal protein S12 methylthiotransferase RimO n=1 Tax=Sporosalibacterium faouarense TaxID=516123 RepID=UPI00192CD314|nr:30S ribosomal protein S12 methylthiotransferase RimO [Sporosalibacterium faouarense]
MTYNIAMVSLGCSKNLIDSEMMTGNLQQKGFKFINDPEDADIIIINTCGFIDAAKEESIDAIVEAENYKTEGRCKVLIVSGCMAERYKEELMEQLPEVDAVVGTGNINEIYEIINETLKGKKVNRTGKIDNDYYEDLPRVISTPQHSAYIKIAEGCDSFCTYCIIPKLRGSYRSRKMDSVLKEAKTLAENGTKELILIAQDTGRYGFDLYGEYKLPELLDELNKIDGIKWIRLLYVYPDAFTDSLVQSIKNNEKVVNYVDMPIQHINNNVLKRMNRKTSKEMITDLITNLREEIPDMTIRTTVIVGFPGETEEEFMELYEYIGEAKFDRLGAFTYSKEEGTPAAKMEGHLGEEIKEQRQNKIMELQQEISIEKNRHRINNTYTVLIEEKVEDGVFIGRTYMDSPEIDCIVYVHSDKKLEIGSFVAVNITDSLEYDLIGEIANESSK